MENTVCRGLIFLVEKGKECPLSTVRVPSVGLFARWAILEVAQTTPSKTAKQQQSPNLTEPMSEWNYYDRVQPAEEPFAHLLPPCSGLRVNSTICWWTAVVTLEQCDLD